MPPSVNIEPNFKVKLMLAPCSAPVFPDRAAARVTAVRIGSTWTDVVGRSRVNPPEQRRTATETATLAARDPLLEGRLGRGCDLSDPRSGGMSVCPRVTMSLRSSPPSGHATGTWSLAWCSVHGRRLRACWIACYELLSGI